MKNTHKLYTDVIAKSGSKNEPLEVTENGTYEAPKGTGYSPVKVNIKLEGNPLQDVIDNQGGDGVPRCITLFYNYHGTSLDSVLSTIDTSNVKDMSSMFSNCANLTSIPKLYTSNVTIMSRMFVDCSKLENVPQLDTSNVTDMEGMFSYCYKLTTIPQLDTSKVRNMYRMFYQCYNLTTIPQLDTSKVTDFSNIFYNNKVLTSIGFYGFTRSIDISYTALEHDALVAFLNQAGTAYNSSQKITMGSTKLALLSDDEKAIATNKGWTLA